MTGPESLSPGGQANLNFVIKTRAEEPGLEELIPEGRRCCSTAWNRTRRGQGQEHVKVCPGRTETDIGGLTIMLCRLPDPSKPPPVPEPERQK
jgi:hypothetical protein